MRPMIKPALRRLQRDRTTVQIGTDPCRAVMLTGAGVTEVLASLDGTRDRGQVLAAASAAGVSEDRAGRLLTALRGCGVLDDAATDTRPLRELPLAERDRLAPELASVSLQSGEADGGVPPLARRRRSSVHVYGTGRVGAATACLLAASGVGRVQPVDPEPTRHADLGPAGLDAEDVGTRREEAAASAIGRAAPTTRTDGRGSPDLAVLTPVDGDEPELPDALFQARVPHLFAAVRETRGVVGPLVLPGGSTCLRCQHLHRADRDPAWPRVAAQLASARAGPGPCAAVLATAVAALAAHQVLIHLDGVSAPPPTVNGSLELILPGWQCQRRPWPPHPRCGCGWDTTDDPQ